MYTYHNDEVKPCFMQRGSVVNKRLLKHPLPLRALRLIAAQDGREDLHTEYTAGQAKDKKKHNTTQTPSHESNLLHFGRC